MFWSLAHGIMLHGRHYEPQFTSNRHNLNKNPWMCYHLISFLWWNVRVLWQGMWNMWSSGTEHTWSWRQWLHGAVEWSGSWEHHNGSTERLLAKLVLVQFPLGLHGCHIHSPMAFPYLHIVTFSIAESFVFSKMRSTMNNILYNIHLIDMSSRYTYSYLLKGSFCLVIGFCFFTEIFFFSCMYL